MRRAGLNSQRLSYELLEERHLLASVTLEPTIDNSLYEDDLGIISNGAGRYLFSGRTGPRADEKLRRALLSFSLSDQIPADATITSVSLQLRVSKSRDSEVYSMSLHRVLSDWGEGSSVAPDPGGEGTAATNGDATWIHGAFPGRRWQTAGGDFEAGSSAAADVGADGFYTWTSDEMANDVVRWLAEPARNFGWILLGNETQLTTAKRFDSRESPDAANRPQLTIEFEETTKPRVSIAPASVQEGDGGSTVLRFTVSLSEPATETVTVRFTTQDGDAIADEDYLALADVITFDPGSDRQTIEIDVIGDLTTEGDEVLMVVLEQATNADIEIGSANGVIENDDAQPTLIVASADLPEMSAEPTEVMVSLSNPSAFPIQVSYTTVSDTAQAGEDFVDQTGLIEFAPGETVQRLELTVLNDDQVEGDETFDVEFDNPINVSLAGPLTVRILDDDESTDSPWHNSALPEDIDGDGLVVPLDALLVINELNSSGPRMLGPPGDGQPPPYLDVDGDHQLAPIDALLVINRLNAPAVAALERGTTAAGPDASQIVAAIELIFADEERDSRRVQSMPRSRVNYPRGT